MKKTNTKSGTQAYERISDNGLRKFHYSSHIMNLLGEAP